MAQRPQQQEERRRRQRRHCSCIVFLAILFFIASFPCCCRAWSIDDEDAAADAVAAETRFVNFTYDRIAIDASLFISDEQLIVLQEEWWNTSTQLEWYNSNRMSSSSSSSSNAGCRPTGNPIDDCWRCDPLWHQHRKRLADCAIGFGRGTIGGKSGAFYVVTDASDDDPANPRPGTLRYGVVQDIPLWIVFSRDMVIRLSQELIINSHKTIDGRGASVRIAHGACLTVQYVTNVIVHGIFVHDCRRTGPAMVRSTPEHVGWRTIADGDGISLFGARNVWIDHCFLARCSDGLIDAIVGSTGITISNSYFTSHNKVMLLGHSDSYTSDRDMQVTIAYNHFGEGLVQRMPRCRLGYFHIVNNHYTHWQMYAIGGSANPTINSQGNRFIAPPNPFCKQVTKRELSTQQGWMKWNWRSEGDSFVNGAYFRPSGAGSSAVYARASSLSAKPASLVPMLTASAGPLKCNTKGPC